MTLSVRHFVALVLAVIPGGIAFHYVPAPLPEISREQFLAEVTAGHVPKVEIYDQEWVLSESSESARSAPRSTAIAMPGCRIGCALPGSKSGTANLHRAFSASRPYIWRK